MSEQTDKILTIKGVATHIWAGNGMIDSHVGNGAVSALKISGFFLFRWGDLGNWIASRMSKEMVE